jgi:hypothetical protein
MAARRQALTFTIVVITLVGFFLASPLAPAWVFYLDDRQVSHTSMVGMLEIELPEGRSQGTAVLVDECGILTNFHVVFGPWYVTALRAPSRQFPGTFILTEVTLPDGSHPASRATPVVWGHARNADLLTQPGHDWAYLVLDECLGRQHQHFDLRMPRLEEAEPTGGDYIAIGYSTGRQMTDPACSVYEDRSADWRGWLHDCALLSGDSGGPILKRSSMAILAIGRGILDYGECRARSEASGGGLLGTWDVLCANVAVPMTAEIVERIRAAATGSAIQRALNRLGYDAGPLGAVDEPRARAAIEAFQKDVGLPVTGEPSDILRKIIEVRMNWV